MSKVSTIIIITGTSSIVLAQQNEIMRILFIVQCVYSELKILKNTSEVVVQCIVLVRV